MDNKITSLAGGVISGTEKTRLYVCPNNTQTRTTLISLVNTASVQVTVNLYKFKNNIMFLISPNNFALLGNHMAQEDGQLTLEEGDAIYAECNIKNVIQYSISGFIDTQNPRAGL